MVVAEHRVDQIEKQLEELTKAVNSLTTAAALLQQSNDRIEGDVKEARGERQRIASELGAYGIQLSKFVDKIDTLQTGVTEMKPAFAKVNALETDVKELRPVVETLENNRQMALGAGKVGAMLLRVFSAIGVGSIIAGIIAAAKYLTSK